MKAIYTEPKLYKGKKDWYVWFRVKGHPNPYKFRKNVNRDYPDLKEREKQFKFLIEALKIKLRQGWLPSGDKPTYLLDELPTKSMTLLEAIDFGMAKKFIKKKTRQDYDCTARFVKDAIIRLRWERLPVAETKRQHIKILMENIREHRNWSANAYNKNLGYLQGILKPLVKWFIIESNPAHDQETYTVVGKEDRKTATPEEQRKIKALLRRVHFNYYRFIKTLFHTGIRPEELTEAQIKNIDLNRRLIRLDWDDTKTNKNRIVPIPRELYEMLCGMDLHQHPRDFYLFGTFKPAGKRYQKGYPEFIPAPNKMVRSRSTRLWKHYVKDGLGIDVDQYAEKHSGANAAIKAGISQAAIKRKFGHESMLTTEVYMTDLQELLFDEIRNSHIRFDDDITD